MSSDTENVPVGSTSPASNGTKRAREDQTELSPEPTSPQQHRAVSVDELLVPLPEPEWNTFTDKLRDKFDNVLADEARLMDEYRQWCWVRQTNSSDHVTAYIVNRCRAAV